jgi:anti-sigma regulatory factor (Ser/Thr protein kinase)
VAAQGTGRPARGIGEPIWFGRSHEELVECGRHEALINVAFADADGFRLLCPYDTTALDGPVIEEALHNHPHVTSPGAVSPSDAYTGAIPGWLETPLPPVPSTAEVLTFHAANLAPVRHRAAALAIEGGLSRPRVDDLVVAVSEAITNTALHAGGTGDISLWQEGSTFLCEIRDSGAVTDPLAGRVRPTTNQLGGRGLWLMHQLCDLVQMRRHPDGQAIRLHMRG